MSRGGQGASESELRQNWELVDNDLIGSHSEALRQLGTHHRLPIHVATGYVGLDGLVELARAGLSLDTEVRLLLGAQPSFDELGAGRPPALRIRERFAQSIAALRRERNFGAFPSQRRRQLERVVEMLKRDATEVRRYVKRFLHGKAYIFAEFQHDGPLGAAVVTSANLTAAGLHTNMELGMVHYQPGVVKMTLDWYERLWDDADDFKDELLELLLPEEQSATPYEIYLRALYEYFGDDEVGAIAGESGLAGFQRDGYLRARAIMERYGGVLYADGVGMGKTEIGIEFIREFERSRGQHVLVIAPASLKESLWSERIRQERLGAQVISYHGLAMDLQVAAPPSAGGPRSTRRVMSLDKSAYKLVVVDEAHAFRNATNTWWAALDRLMTSPPGEEPKRLLMLTATPVNNTLWDLHNLFMLFARHDAAFAGDPLRIRSLKRHFKEAGATIEKQKLEQNKPSPAHLFKLLDALVVRRQRDYVMRHHRGEKLAGGVEVKFPEPRLTERRYDVDTAHPGAVGEIREAIDGLTMARYRPSAYTGDGTQSNTENYNAEFWRSMLLKRLESSWPAALTTAKRSLERNEAVLAKVVATANLTDDDLQADDSDDADEQEEFSEAVRESISDSKGNKWDPAELTPEFARDVRHDISMFKQITSRLEALGRGTDEKLLALREIFAETPSQKAVIFTQFKDTAEYLRKAFQHDPSLLNGRKWYAIIGSETPTQERQRAIDRFCPGGDIDGAAPPVRAEDEVDVLLSTDVLSEGQNLQQAQAVISYDMPWNPQRVVQRNGRVIRLRSQHDEVYLYTLLLEDGELDGLLALEARIRAKIDAANAAVGMESQVLESADAVQQTFESTEEELERLAKEYYEENKEFADRIVHGDESLLDETESGTNAAYLGEEYRADLREARKSGVLDEIKQLPWGIGAAFVHERKLSGLPAVFFACQTKTGEHYIRMVAKDGKLLEDIEDPEMLLRIKPADQFDGAKTGQVPLEELHGWDLADLFDVAAASIVEEHNALSDPKNIEPQVKLVQRWAIEVLKHAQLESGGPELQLAVDALRVDRTTAVQRALSGLRREYPVVEKMTRVQYSECAGMIMAITEEHGLAPVEMPEPTVAITKDDIGVVCYQVVGARDSDLRKV